MGESKYSWRDFEWALVAAFLTTLTTALAATTSQQDIYEMHRADYQEFSQMLHDIGPLPLVLIGGAITLTLTLVSIARVSNEKPIPHSKMFNHH